MKKWNINDEFNKNKIIDFNTIDFGEIGEYTTKGLAQY